MKKLRIQLTFDIPHPISSDPDLQSEEEAAEWVTEDMLGLYDAELVSCEIIKGDSIKK